MNRLDYITKLLIEGRVDDVKLKYTNPELPRNQRLLDNEIDALVKGDPSGNHKYLDWMAGVISRGSLLGITPQYVIPLVTKFHKERQRLEKKDLYQYSSYPELERALNALGPSKGEMKKIQKKDTHKIYEDDRYLILSPKSEASSCYYGQGTKWCTAAKKGNQFDAYSKTGVLIYIIDKSMTEPKREHYNFNEDGEGTIKPEFKNNVQFGDYAEDLEHYQMYSKMALHIGFDSYKPNMSTLNYMDYEIYDGQDVYMGGDGDWLDFLMLDQSKMFEVNRKVVDYFKSQAKDSWGNLNEDFDWVKNIPEANEYRFFDIYVCDDNEYNEETGEDECIGGGSHFVKIPKQEVIEIWDLDVWDMGGPGDEGRGIIEWGIGNGILDPYRDVVEYVLEITKKEYCYARGNYEEEDKFLCGDFIKEDFEWAGEIPSLVPGHLFDLDDIVYGDDDDKKINILGDDIIIRMDEMEFITNILNIDEGYCEIMLKPFIEYGYNYEPYDVDVDYDSYEERYIFYQCSSEQLNRINELLTKIGLKPLSENEYQDEGNAEYINDYLKMIHTGDNNNWENLVSDTVYGLAQRVELNRWRALGQTYRECLEKSKMTSFIEYDNYDEKVVLTYDLKDIKKDISQFLIDDLSCLDTCWTDDFYNDYDPSGYDDFDGDFERTMDSLEEADLEELQTLAKLGFDMGLQLEVGDYLYTVTEITNDYKVVVRVDKDGKPLGKNKIDLDELPDFLYNYRLFENK